MEHFKDDLKTLREIVNSNAELSIGHREFVFETNSDFCKLTMLSNLDRSINTIIVTNFDDSETFSSASRLVFTDDLTVTDAEVNTRGNKFGRASRRVEEEGQIAGFVTSILISVEAELSSITD
jgi:hypothetical protein